MADHHQKKLEHFSHKHPLTLVEEEEEEVGDSSENSSRFPIRDNLRCYGCTDKISVPYYRCEEDCPYFCLHHSCAHLPMTMKHQRHSRMCPSQDLAITKCAQPLTSCRVCSQRWFRFSYLCSHCHFMVDIKCAFNPLARRRRHYFREQQTRYNRFLPFHHNHDLILVEDKALDDTSAAAVQRADSCSGCGENIASGGPYYTCPTCNNYSLHHLCAHLPREINHQKHPTCVLKLEELLFPTRLEERCSVCRAQGSGFGFSCIPCKFVLDIVCALEGITFDKSFHPQHHLSRSLTKPSQCCFACDKDSEGVSYRCNTCRFWVHDQCASLPLLRDRSSHDHEHDTSLIYAIPKNFSEVDVYCEICGKYMKHHNWAYHCHKCRFFSHIYDCADPHRNGGELSIEADAILPLPLADELITVNKVIVNGVTVEHHRHPMSIFADQFESNAAIDVTLSFANLIRGSAIWPTFHVDGKDYSGSTFSFFKDKLVMHVANVDLPHYAKHESHPHILKSTFSNTFTRCYGCEQSFFGNGFRCTVCAFTLDTYCALLPKRVKHGYDKHPFELTYASVEGVEEYICEICEGDVHPAWFYHCVDCDQSIHARCIWKAYFEFGRFYKILPYDMKLTLVPPGKDILFECVICDKEATCGHGFALITQWFDFVIHLMCTSEDEVEVILHNGTKANVK